MGGIFCRIGRQTIFQVGVVSTDVDCAAGFVEPYLGQLVFLLDSCNHFEFHLISDRICKRPVFAGKNPVQDRYNFKNFLTETPQTMRRPFGTPAKRNLRKITALTVKQLSPQIGEIAGVKRNCFLKNLRIVCRFLRMSFFYSCPGISPQRRQAHIFAQPYPIRTVIQFSICPSIGRQREGSFINPLNK